MTLRAGGAALAGVVLAACAAVTSPKASSPRLPLSALPGWSSEDYASAYAAFRQTCGLVQGPGLARACRSAQRSGPLDKERARRFFEARFRARPLGAEGLLTGYFAPEYEARHAPDAEFSAPLRPKPVDLNIGADRPYLDRAAIEAQAAKDALAWLRPEDLFFLQVQGSGLLRFEDGARSKASYAANNGRPFVAIANPMRRQGLLGETETSGAAIHGWLAAHRGPAAEAIMRLNPRYIFFRLEPDDGRPPKGAAKTPLSAGRAVAVDPVFHSMGELLWLDASHPGDGTTYRRLAIALDTGGAIQGAVRADLYIGQGAAAGDEAGRIRHPLRLYQLVPR